MIDRNIPGVSLIACCILIQSGTVLAQERQGNIVEYFGKEKVSEVREGEVIHTFTKGLVLPGERSRMSSATTPAEPLIASLLFDAEFQAKEGQASHSNSERKWESIAVAEKNEFNDRRLRSGYLYLEYNSPNEKIVVVDASGHTKLFVNGMPYEGDHYDYGWTLIPIQLKAGNNTFVLTGGRFPRMRARLLSPHSPIQLVARDQTRPDLLKEAPSELLGAVRIVNSSSDWFHGELECVVNGSLRRTPVGPISPLNSRKVSYQIPPTQTGTDSKLPAKLVLKDSAGNVRSNLEIEFNVRSVQEHHNRTFLSAIDHSVQYFGVAPCTNPELERPAMFLSVHGASVEASGQARAYQPKDWGHLVAPTNRRAFGFAWEDWGRLDAMEVLDYAEELFHTDPQRTYLTGHSMGGHGTWYLGATYPDRFAAIAPAAGYPDLLGYRNSFRRRLRNASPEELQRMGMSPERAERMLKQMEEAQATPSDMQAMIDRAGNPSRTLKLKRNYLQQGVYILHGEKDTVVPTFLAREMRTELATFHPDFTYYEYPEGTHWYGNHSVDWPPIFDYFNFRSIPTGSEVKKFEFHTASPGVSASSHFITIVQQEKPLEISSCRFTRTPQPSITTENVAMLRIDTRAMGSAESIQVDGQEFLIQSQSELTIKKDKDQWRLSPSSSKTHKGPHRNGGFKDAFNHHLLLVYATQGSEEENAWYYNRARFDAQTFWYRANGNVELLPDTEFSAKDHPDRNIILYGNRDNNTAWKALLAHCPIQVTKGNLQFADRTISGEDHGGYFIYPRADSDTASVGVVTATGEKGMKAAYANWYILNGTSFPDVLLFDHTAVNDGISGVLTSGFFGNDWSVETGDFVWRKDG